MEVLKKAERIFRAYKNESKAHFETIASLWVSYGVPVTPLDVCVLLALSELVNERSKHKCNNLAKAIAYLMALSEIEGDDQSTCNNFNTNQIKKPKNENLFKGLEAKFKQEFKGKH